MTATDAASETGSETASEAERARPRLTGQLARFVTVGALAFLVDYGVYRALLAADVWIHLAKAISFVAGTSTAYAFNRRWTFDATGGRRQFAAFLALYGTTFGVNVGVNALVLHVLPASWWEITAAFVIAQGTATTINFAVQRLVIFRR